MMRTYPTAITCNGAKYPDKARRSALKWAISEVKKTRGSLLVYASGRVVISGTDILSETIRRYSIPTQTFKQPVAEHWDGGPIIALAPDPEHLAKIDCETRSTALCVIPWDSESTRGWELLHKPERLEGADPEPEPVKLNPITASAMRSMTLSVNLGNELAGAADHDDAVNTLTVLYDNGFPIPGPNLYIWALSHGWGEPGSRRLKEMADKLNSGHRLRLKTLHKADSRIIDYWKEHVDEDDESIVE